MRLVSHTTDRKTKYHPLFLGSTQVMGEIAKSDDYKGTGQVRSVKEAGYVRTAVFWRSTPLSRGIDSRKILAIQEDGTV